METILFGVFDTILCGVIRMVRVLFSQLIILTRTAIPLSNKCVLILNYWPGESTHTVHMVKQSPRKLSDIRSQKGR